jgi:hypothetical protein
MAGDPEEWQVQHHPHADGFSEDREGLLLPTPSGKPCRQLTFRPGLAINAEETKEELISRISQARHTHSWWSVTDPQFGEVIRLTAAAAEDLLWIGDIWIDMTAAREQLRQREMAQRMAALGVQAAPPQLVSPNRAARRR